MKLEDVEVFVEAVRAGSLAGAARRLSMSAMAASRALNALEAELGVRLVHRTTRSLSPTGDGEVFAQSAETPIPGVRVQVSEARGVKCPRCWKHSVTDHADGLCARCAAVVREQLGE